MTSDIHSPGAFFSEACRQSMLTPDTVPELVQEAQARGVTAGQLALAKGLLDPVQVDIVETLLRPVEVIPGYDIHGVIGRGGMGVVYRAEQKNLNRPVAIKMILLSELSRSEAAARFEREARAVARLRHPNIVTPYDFGRHAGRLYLVMELLEGETLDHVIRRASPMPEHTVWALARQVASGLAHATQLGVIHRDIKPGNLMLVQPPMGIGLPAGTPLVKIMDFGLARLGGDSEPATQLTASGALVGTPLFIAPEQFQSAELDCRADIYSLGITVYLMLCGRSPFRGTSTWDILAEKQRGDLTDLRTQVPNLTAESAALVAAMTATKPDERIGSYDALIARIDSIGTVNRGSALGDAAASTIQLPLDSAPATRVLDGRGRVRPWHAMGLAALVLALAGGAWWWRGLSAGHYAGNMPFVPSGPGRDLFNGLSLNGWVAVEGGWNAEKDAEGAHVLAGTGVIRRPFGALAHYRLTLGVDPHEATAVEVHFALHPPTPGMQRRAVLRITADCAQMGERPSDRGSLVPTSALRPFPPAAKSAGPVYHEVRIERHRSGWRVFFRGEPVGVLDATGTELPELRLATEGGPAHFEGIRVVTLVEPSP
jgi:hypothetical protein